MGTLTKYQINSTGCNIFIETGTGSGGSLAHAYASGAFDKLYSVEIHKESAEKVMADFSGIPSVKKNGPFERGNLPDNFGGLPSEMRNIGFVNKLFGNRKIQKDYRDEGYLIISQTNTNFEFSRLTKVQRLVRNIRRRISKF